jgi:hypothetical protein
MPLQDGPAAADGCRFVPDFGAVALVPTQVRDCGVQFLPIGEGLYRCKETEG